MAIDFTLTKMQRDIQLSARDFAARFLAPIAEKVNRIADPWEAFLATRETYREMADAGFTESFIPTEYGGLGYAGHSSIGGGARARRFERPHDAARLRFGAPAAHSAKHVRAEVAFSAGFRK